MIDYINQKANYMSYVSFEDDHENSSGMVRTHYNIYVDFDDLKLWLYN